MSDSIAQAKRALDNLDKPVTNPEELAETLNAMKMIGKYLHFQYTFLQAELYHSLKRVDGTPFGKDVVSVRVAASVITRPLKHAADTALKSALDSVKVGTAYARHYGEGGLVRKSAPKQAFDVKGRPNRNA